MDDLEKFLNPSAWEIDVNKDEKSITSTIVDVELDSIPVSFDGDDCMTIDVSELDYIKLDYCSLDKMSELLFKADEAISKNPFGYMDE